MPITTNLGSLSFNASSWYDINTMPQFAKLYSKEKGYWKPAKSNENEYLVIDLGYPDTIYGIEISGNPLNDEFVISYIVTYSLDGVGFSYILYHGQPEVIFKFYLLTKKYTFFFCYRFSVVHILMMK